MIQLIVSDLDGTLLADHRNIHPDNIMAIQEAQAKGVKFAVASGRTAASCSRLLERHGLDAYIIAVNGCQTVDHAFGNPIETHYLDKRVAAETMAIFKEHGLDAFLYTEDAIVYTSEEMRAHYEHNPRTLTLAGDKAVAEAVQSTPMKTSCCFRLGQEAAFEAARAACAGIPGVELTSSWVDNFEVMPAGVSKGVAVKALAERLGIPQRAVLAFGDNDNDISMLTWAGIGLAMGNAQPPVKQAADGVVSAHDKGGVAQGIRRYVGGAGVVSGDNLP